MKRIENLISYKRTEADVRRDWTGTERRQAKRVENKLDLDAIRAKMKAKR